MRILQCAWMRERNWWRGGRSGLQTRGNSGNRRAELELAGSKSKGPGIKQWLKDADYFGPYLNRMRYAQRQERCQELVVVEGRSGWGAEVGIITMFRRNEAGQVTDKVDAAHNKAQAAIGKPLLRLISSLNHAPSTMVMTSAYSTSFLNAARCWLTMGPHGWLDLGTRLLNSRAFFSSFPCIHR